jgi:hypothetical protein
MLEAIEWQLELAQPFPKWDCEGSVDCTITSAMAADKRRSRDQERSP